MRSRSTSGAVPGPRVGGKPCVPMGPRGYDCRLGPDLQAKLAVWLDEGPAAHGWRDGQVDRRKGVHADRAEVPPLLERLRGDPAAAPDGLQRADARPARRRTGRGRGHRMAGGDLAGGKTLRAATGAFVCFEDEAGVTGLPPKGRTWGRRGITPPVRVSGRGRGRLSVAGLLCYRPGLPARLCYRLRRHTGRKGERRSLGESDYYIHQDDEDARGHGLTGTG